MSFLFCCWECHAHVEQDLLTRFLQTAGLRPSAPACSGLVAGMLTEEGFGCVQGLVSSLKDDKQVEGKTQPIKSVT